MENKKEPTDVWNVIVENLDAGLEEHFKFSNAFEQATCNGYKGRGITFIVTKLTNT